MCHPSRAHLLPYLWEKLGNVPVAMDEKNNIWDTCKRAWKLHDPTADYHFVIQDDAIIGHDFYERLQKVVSNGEYVYNLYLGRPRLVHKVLKCKEEGIDHLIEPHTYHEIALGFPVKYINEMIEYGDKINSVHDRFLNEFKREKGLKVYFPLPSLIDHRAEPSLHNYNRGHYKPVATWFE